MYLISYIPEHTIREHPDIYKVTNTIRNRLFYLSRRDIVKEIFHFAEHNQIFIKSEDLDNTKVIGVCSTRHVEPIDGRTCVMTIEHRSHEGGKFTDVLLSEEFNEFRTYKLVGDISVRFVKIENEKDLVIFYGGECVMYDTTHNGKRCDFHWVFPHKHNENIYVQGEQCQF